MTTNSQILEKNLQFSRQHLQIFCASDGLQMKYLSIQIEHHFIKSVFTRLEQKVEEKKNSGNRKWNRGSILITRVSSFMIYSGFSGSVPTRGPSLIFHPTLLFRPTPLKLLLNCVPNMLIQDNTVIWKSKEVRENCQ